MSGLDDLLERLADELEPDGSRPAAVEAIERALAVLVAYFDGLALVRGGRIQLVLERRTGGARLLVAASASAADLASAREAIERDGRRLVLAGELLGLALGLPRGGLRRLGAATDRIVELGAELSAG